MIIENKKKIGKLKKKQLVKKKEPFKARLMAKKLMLTIIALSIMTAVSAWLLAGSDLFIIKRFIIEGNKNLTKEEVVSMTGITNRNLFTLNKRIIAGKLKDSAWISKAYVRKIYPDTLMLKIDEVTPIALYDVKGTIYIIDENGERLDIVPESRKDLPMIKLATSNNEAFLEAVQLSKIIIKDGILAWTPVEINGKCVEDLSITLNGVKVVVGSGDYETKLQKYMLLKEDIESRKYMIEYIDVRFQKRLIVKTLKNV
ncbi:MAG: FtsQ-type POTRA domain-containing protein [Nitrospirae bacterium]|nr:FtsQ-type POTRA domain-containing protein [Nitrospirota bacterium]